MQLRKCAREDGVRKERHPRAGGNPAQTLVDAYPGLDSRLRGDDV